MKNGMFLGTVKGPVDPRFNPVGEKFWYHRGTLNRGNPKNPSGSRKMHRETVKQILENLRKKIIIIIKKSTTQPHTIVPSENKFSSVLTSFAVR